jgi:hypothetical protein
MNCSEFTNWLDAGQPSRHGRRAREHAAGCERCAALLAADLGIEALLARGPVAPLRDRARFVDRVMAQVATAGQEPLPHTWPAPAPLPWWVRAAADPAAALAFALLALLLWRPHALSDLTRLLSDRFSVLAWPAITEARSYLGLDRPVVAVGLGLLALLLIGWASLHLYRWTERVTRRSAGARGGFLS